VNYTYDVLYRLKTAVTTGSASYPQWGLSWTYDRYGNRTAQAVTAGSAPPNSVTVDATTNRITGAPYSYDAGGNMTNDGLNTLTYDGENRLVTSSGSTYSYDGGSLRVQKSSGGTTTVYIYSGTKVIAEYLNGAAPPSPTREYIYTGASLIATIEGGATKYHHTDHLSVRVTTDTNGNVLGQQGHYPYGESWYAASATTKWQFTNYERDSESANDYAISRNYVSRLGRFFSPDPVDGNPASPQTLGLYAYVTDDPVDFTDPDGRLTPATCGGPGRDPGNPFGTPPFFPGGGFPWPTWWPGAAANQRTQSGLCLTPECCYDELEACGRRAEQGFDSCMTSADRDDQSCKADCRILQLARSLLYRLCVGGCAIKYGRRISKCATVWVGKIQLCSYMVVLCRAGVSIDRPPDYPLPNPWDSSP